MSETPIQETPSFEEYNILIRTAFEQALSEFEKRAGPMAAEIAKIFLEFALRQSYPTIDFDFLIDNINKISDKHNEPLGKIKKTFIAMKDGKTLPLTIETQTEHGEFYDRIFFPFGFVLIVKSPSNINKMSKLAKEKLVEEMFRKKPAPLGIDFGKYEKDLGKWVTDDVSKTKKLREILEHGFRKTRDKIRPRIRDKSFSDGMSSIGKDFEKIGGDFDKVMVDVDKTFDSMRDILKW